MRRPRRAPATTSAAACLLAAALALGCSDQGAPACKFNSIGPLFNDATLGVTKEGAVWTWGQPSLFPNPGQRPYLYIASTSVESLQSRADTVCLRYRDGSQSCSGASLLEDLPTPATLAVSSTPVPPLLNPLACLLFADSTLRCWDAEGGIRTPAVGPTLPAAPISIALGDAGLKEGCAVTQGHDVWCWGGKLVDDDAAPLGHRFEAIPPAELEALHGRGQSVAASNAGACAVTTTGEVFCWGALIDPSAPALAPVAVDVGAPATAVVMGGGHACALTDAGHVVCWGDDAHGQTSAPNGARTPAQVPLTGGPIVELAAGVNHTCARHQDGTVSCWGANDVRQLGNEAVTAAQSAVPVRVDGCPAP